MNLYIKEAMKLLIINKYGELGEAAVNYCDDPKQDFFIAKNITFEESENMAHLLSLYTKTFKFEISNDLIMKAHSEVLKMIDIADHRNIIIVEPGIPEEIIEKDLFPALAIRKPGVPVIFLEEYEVVKNRLRSRFKQNAAIVGALERFFIGGLFSKQGVSYVKKLHNRPFVGLKVLEAMAKNGEEISITTHGGVRTYSIRPFIEQSVIHFLIGVVDRDPDIDHVDLQSSDYIQLTRKEYIDKIRTIFWKE